MAYFAARSIVGAFESLRNLGMSDLSRRQMFLKLGAAFTGAVGVLLGIPIVGYLLSPLTRGRNNGYDRWIPLGSIDQFPAGQTRLATYRNPAASSTDGETAEIPCWVRNIDGNNFQVFAINCAHLGCPVRWFPQSRLFMCPCHGGVYYEDGSRASGPPERGLFEYSFKIVDGTVHIKAGELPTPGLSASNRLIQIKGQPPCA
jgi:menaquinol-cytochrome c reductase iron-sulfur subunit